MQARYLSTNIFDISKLEETTGIKLFGEKEEILR